MDDAQARAILRDAGEDPPQRARLSAAWRARATELSNGSSPSGPATEAGQGFTAAEEPATEPEEGGAAEAAAVEQRPRRVRQSRPGRRWRGRSSAQERQRKKPRAALPRVSIDRLCEHVWSALGRMAAPVDPYVSRTLQFQA